MLLYPVLMGTCSLHAGQAPSKWRDRIRRSFSAPRGKALPEPERSASYAGSRGDSEQREPTIERVYPADEPEQAVSALLLNLHKAGETGCHSSASCASNPGGRPQQAVVHCCHAAGTQ